jgi:hypothetical protein
METTMGSSNSDSYTLMAFSIIVSIAAALGSLVIVPSKVASITSAPPPPPGATEAVTPRSSCGATSRWTSVDSRLAWAARANGPPLP